MSLVSADIDTIIVSHIFCRCEKWNRLLINRIFYVFGKAQFNGFLRTCREHFLHLLYQQYETQDFKLVLMKVLRKKNLELFDCYQMYKKELLPDELTFRDRNALHRLMIHYLSIYYGYLPICIKNVQREKFGYEYSYFHYDHPNQVIPYHELKTYRLHNLEYYDLVETRPQFWNNLYRLKENVNIYKKGVTVDSKDLLCIKIMDIDDALL
jgi:hypothetical protein